MLIDLVAFHTQMDIGASNFHANFVLNLFVATTKFKNMNIQSENPLKLFTKIPPTKVADYTVHRIAEVTRMLCVQHVLLL